MAEPMVGVAEEIGGKKEEKSSRLVPGGLGTHLCA